METSLTTDSKAINRDLKTAIAHIIIIMVRAVNSRIAHISKAVIARATITMAARKGSKATTTAIAATTVRAITTMAKRDSRAINNARKAVIAHATTTRGGSKEVIVRARTATNNTATIVKGATDSARRATIQMLNTA